MLIWSLFRQPSSEVAPEPASEEASADTAPSDSDDEADDDEVDEEEAEEATEEATTTSRPSRGSTSSDPSSVVDGPTPPLLGEETGLTLAIGRRGRSELELLDLDTGERLEIEGARGSPVGAMGTTVVLTSDNDGSTHLLDLADPEGGDPDPGEQIDLSALRRTALRGELECLVEER